MAKKILTPDEMTEARHLYEKEGWGYGRIAAKFSVSKPTVQGWAKNWQRDYGVAPLPAGKKADAGAGAAASQAKVTENTVTGETQAGYSYPDGSTGAPGRVVADVYVAPTDSQGMTTDVTPGVGTVTTPSQSNDYADEIRIPAGLDELDREAFVAAAIVARQRRINGRHLKELHAVRSQLYSAIKGATQKGGSTVAIAVKNSIMALQGLHASEMDAELQRVRLEVAEFVGKPMKPTPCRIMVHVQPGEQLLPAAATYGRNAIEVTDVIATEKQNA